MLGSGVFFLLALSGIALFLEKGVEVATVLRMVVTGMLL